MKLRTLLGACLLIGASWAMARTDMAVTEVNGEACYCYTVGKQQTLYSVADELGLSRDEIVKYNPAANDGIRAGQKLYFPVDKFPTLGNVVPEKDISGTYTVKKGDSFYGICYKLGISSEALLAANPSIASGVAVGQVLRVPSQAFNKEINDQAEKEAEEYGRRIELKPVRPVYVVLDEENNEEAADSTDTAETTAEEAAIEKTTDIVVMLPFMLNHNDTDKHAQNVTDFYKGLLMAADSLSTRAGKVNIYAMDTEGSPERVRQFCLTDTFRNATVVIAPDDIDQLQTVASHASGSDLYVFNAFVVRDSSYLANPRMLQSYIPSDIMLAKAADAVQNLFPGATPVILHRVGGREDKSDFIDQLTARFAGTDTPVKTLDFTEALTTDDFGKLPQNGNYVLIPASGSLAEFNKISAGVLEAQQDGTGGSTYALFGYPDWTSFRGPTREMLHRLGATIYTRFYNDPFSEQVKELESRYNRDFGGNMLDAVPSPALLGFDTGYFLMGNLRRGGSGCLPESDAYYGAQSSFRFVKADPTNENSGYYNDELYVIRFSIDGIHTDRLQ